MERLKATGMVCRQSQLTGAPRRCLSSPVSATTVPEMTSIIAKSTIPYQSHRWESVQEPVDEELVTEPRIVAGLLLLGTLCPQNHSPTPKPFSTDTCFSHANASLDSDLLLCKQPIPLVNCVMAETGILTKPLFPPTATPSGCSDGRYHLWKMLNKYLMPMRSVEFLFPKQNDHSFQSSSNTSHNYLGLPCPYRMFFQFSVESNEQIS